MRRVIDALRDGEFRLRDGRRRGDQRGGPVDRAARRARRSTSPAPRRSCPSNFNAPSAVAMAAVLYVFRTLVDDDIPLNSGLPAAAAHRSSRRARCSPRRTRPRSPRATWRPPRRSPARCTPRLGGDGRGLRDDEQRHLRQRPAPVLRDGGQRVRRGRVRSATDVVQTSMTNSRLDRPRGAGVALTRCCCESSAISAAGQRRGWRWPRRPRRRSAGSAGEPRSSPR